jgi:hypothetical protein
MVRISSDADRFVPAIRVAGFVAAKLKPVQIDETGSVKTCLFEGAFRDIVRKRRVDKGGRGVAPPSPHAKRTGCDKRKGRVLHGRFHIVRVKERFAAPTAPSPDNQTKNGRLGPPLTPADLAALAPPCEAASDDAPFSDGAAPWGERAAPAQGAETRAAPPAGAARRLPPWGVAPHEEAPHGPAPPDEQVPHGQPGPAPHGQAPHGEPGAARAAFHRQGDARR